MSLSQEELMFIQSQLEGLESIFLELLPFGVELKRQQVQDYYDKRFEQATKPIANVAESELRRQFNTKANQVRNIVDSAESLGEAGSKLNLIRAAASLPNERSKPLPDSLWSLCQMVLSEHKLNGQLLADVLDSADLGVTEARVLLASVMFLIVEEVDQDGKGMLVRDLLSKIIEKVTAGKLLPGNDPFLIEAQCSLEAMKDEESA